MLLTPKQAEYVRESHHRWNFKGGATRSGKTYLDYRYIIPARIRERARLDGLNVILGVTRSTIERNVLQPMRTLFGPGLVGEINSENIVSLFGSPCYALGAEKASQVSKLRGASINCISCNYGRSTATFKAVLTADENGLFLCYNTIVKRTPINNGVFLMPFVGGGCFLPCTRAGCAPFGRYAVKPRWVLERVKGRARKETKNGVVEIDNEKRLNWHNIRGEYIAGGISQRKLAEKYGISFSTIQKKCQREKWTEAREEAKIKVAENVVQKTAETAADNATIAANIKRKGLLMLERLFDDFAQHTATEHRESNDGVVDVKRLRDLTAAYKDLTSDIATADTNNDLLQSLLDIERRAGL